VNEAMDNNNSKAQERQEEQNAARSNDKVPGIDKKLNGPNRPST
jgi:hypothetical protein